jgi:hypothetical protein
MAPQKGHFQVIGEDFELEETLGLSDGMGRTPDILVLMP